MTQPEPIEIYMKVQCKKTNKKNWLNSEEINRQESYFFPDAKY